MDLNSLTKEQAIALSLEARKRGDVELASWLRERASVLPTQSWDGTGNRPVTPATGAGSPADLERKMRLGSLRENLVGEGKVDTPGEYVGQFLNKAGETMTLGFVGDEADAAVRSVIRGTSYDDELAGARGREAQFDEDFPVASVAADLTGGIVGAVANPGSALARGGRTLLNYATRLGLAGGGAAAVEGGMEGEGMADRGIDAAFAAPLGAVGATGLGLGLDQLGRVPGVRRFLSDPADEIGQMFGLNRQQGDVMLESLPEEFGPDGLRALASMPDGGRLADAMPDQMMAASSNSPSVRRNALADYDQRIVDASPEAELNAMLGDPKLARVEQDQIRAGGAAERERLYERAFAQPIDYNTPEGQQILDLYSRVPDRIVRGAEETSRMRGAPFGNPPSTRQLDQVTRSLYDEAEASVGAMGGQSDAGNAMADLARDIRDLVRGQVGEYGDALTKAGDDIGTIRAIRVGSRMLSMPQDAFVATVKGMKPPEISAVKTGIRSAIDDARSRVKASLADPSTDVREVITMLRELSSPAARRKMRAVLGDTEEGQLSTVLARVTNLASLRDALDRRTGDAGARLFEQAMRETAQPGVMGQLRDGNVVGAATQGIRAMIGRAPGQMMRDVAQTYEAIGKVLLQTRGPEARQAVRMLEALRAGKGDRRKLISSIVEAMVLAMPQATEPMGAAMGLQIGTRNDGPR